MGAAWIAFANNPWRSRFEVLLDSAKQLRDQDYHEAAIVTAQIACEVYTEIVLSAMFTRKDIEYLFDPISKLLNNYNLGHNRVRKIYVAVCDDPIHEQPFWSRFKQHTERRNNVVHRGQQADQADADDSITVVRMLSTISIPGSLTSEFPITLITCISVSEKTP
jgi:hypothetical protein